MKKKRLFIGNFKRFEELGNLSVNTAKIIPKHHFSLDLTYISSVMYKTLFF
jgi:hypothetical protein